MLNDQMSIGGNVYYHNFFFLWGHDLGIDGSFRFYPWGGTGMLPEGLFFGGAVGFHYQWGGSSVPGYWGLVDLDGYGDLIGGAITPNVGWKLDVGTPGGFFIEPGIKFPIILGARKTWESYLYERESHYKFDWAFTTIPYIGLGFAF
jgi:hypothetical protein